jgi:hypothetical protein
MVPQISRKVTGAFFVGTAVLALSGAACRRNAPVAATNPSDTLAAAASGAETFYRYGLTDIGHTRDDLLKQFGKPDSVQAAGVQNRHVTSQTDSLITMFYPGLAVQLYRVMGETRREFPSFVRISDNTFIHETAPIRIGVAESDLTDVMGPPSDRADGVLSYVCDTCTEIGNERIEVRIADGKVASVTIFYSYD